MNDSLRATRKHYSAEDKIRIVPNGLRGEDRVAELISVTNFYTKRANAARAA